MNRIQQLVEELNRLSPHERLEAYSNIMFFTGPYEYLRKELKTESITVIDNINYSPRFFEDPLPVTLVNRVFETIPAYTSGTGEFEIGQIIKELEYYRITQSREYFKIKENFPFSRFSGQTGVVVTSGTTGAVFTVLTAIKKNAEMNNNHRKTIIYNAPNYCLPDLYALFYNLTPVKVEGNTENLYLPAPGEILKHCRKHSPLACFLTYPVNPSMACWDSEHIDELKELIAYCQNKEIYLITDNIFQDLSWCERKIPEIFAFSSKCDFLCKITGPSKDRPFMCGHRIGYLVYDKKLKSYIETIKSLTENTVGTTSLAWLSIDSTFRQIENDQKLLKTKVRNFEGRYIFGYEAKNYTADEIYNIIVKENIFDSYRNKLASFKNYIYKSLKIVWDWLNESEVFIPTLFPDFGNLLFITVKTKKYSKESEFFIDMLLELGISFLTGQCFGLDDGKIHFRIAVGSLSFQEILSCLEKMQTYLLEGVKI